MDEQVTAVVVSSSMSYNIILTTNVLYKKITIMIILLIASAYFFQKNTALHEDKHQIIIHQNTTKTEVMPMPIYHPVKYSAPKTQRYGIYYFDYKFELAGPFLPETKKRKSYTPNNSQDSTRLVFTSQKYYHPFKAEKFVNKFINPHGLKYNDIIFVQMRNPIETPRQQRTTNTV